MTRDAGGGKSTEERLQLQREVGAECCGGGTQGALRGTQHRKRGRVWEPPVANLGDLTALDMAFLVTTGLGSSAPSLPPAGGPQAQDGRVLFSRFFCLSSPDKKPFQNSAQKT